MARDAFGIVGSVQGGTFAVREVVAEGGFAVVYRAQHQGFRADVALKCLKVPGTLSDEARTSFLEKFREEGELLFRLSAAIPAVVRPLHFGTLDTKSELFVPFIALEWLEGETLDETIRKRAEQGKPPFGIERAVRLLGPIARALERAHRFPSERGEVSILHRDLKPENVFVAEVQGEQQVKILDFGIGKVKSAATQIAGKHSMDGDAFTAFTPAYGAPEQWLPKRFGQTGTWTDVWGWALTVIEAAIGRCPLEGDAAAIMGSVLDPSARPTPNTLGVPTSADIDRVFARALAIDPRDRYQDVGTFWDDLERLLGCHTPRIDKQGTKALFESMPPPGALVPELELPNVAAMKRQERAQAPTVAFAEQAASPDLSPARRAPDLVRPAAAPAPVPARPSNPSEFLQRGSGVEQVGARLGGGAASGLALDGVSLVPGTFPSAGRRPVPASVARDHTLPPGVAASVLLRRLQAPLKLLAFGAAIAAAAWIYFLATGELFRVGPIGPFFLAGPIVIVAFMWIVVALFREQR